MNDAARPNAIAEIAQIPSLCRPKREDGGRCYCYRGCSRQLTGFTDSFRSSVLLLCMAS
jgi:hypothetical protein